VDLRVLRLEPGWESSIPWDIAGLQSAVQAHGTVDDSLGQDQGWTVEIAIPWAAMADSIGGGGRPKVGDAWRLNLYRIERKAGRQAKAQIDSLSHQLSQVREQSKGKKSKKPEDQAAQLRARLDSLYEHFHQQTEYTAWSETYQRGFHHPARFGVVEFAD